MIVPTPIPVYTLSPLLEDMDLQTLVAVERCIASLTGHVGAVLVTGVGWTERHIVIELESMMGPMVLMELEPDAAGDLRL